MNVDEGEIEDDEEEEERRWRKKNKISSLNYKKNRMILIK